MKPVGVALLLFKKSMKMSDFTEFFDYNHSYVKKEKTCPPLAIIVNLNDIKKDGITKFSVSFLEPDGRLKISKNSSPIDKIDYVSLTNSLVKNIPEENVGDGKKVPLTITQFKDLTSIEKASEYFSKISSIDGFEWKLFGYCDEPSKCITGKLKDICKKCDVFNGLTFHGVGKEQVSI